MEESETPEFVPQEDVREQSSQSSEELPELDQDAGGLSEGQPHTGEGEQSDLPLGAPEDQVDSDDVLIAEAVTESRQAAEPSFALKAVIEAAIYIADEPLTAEQIAIATEQPLEEVKSLLSQLVREYAAPDRGLTVREIAGGYKMSTKPEYHEAIRRFVKRLQPPLKLSLAALETLAVIAYKQPITGPEILEIRGVQGAGVVKTLLDRKLIVTAGRKNVLGKPMMYKTSRDFLVQFGLNSLAELPTLKEFEELGRMALNDAEEDSALLMANDTQAEGVVSANETRESCEESVEAEQQADG